MKSLDGSYELVIASALYRFLTEKLFRIQQKLGFDLIPRHYNSPVPDLRELEDSSWRTLTHCIAIDLSLEKQLKFLEGELLQYKDELRFLDRPTGGSPDFHLFNGMFESCDAEILYCMIRRFKPSRMVEIGAGFSTRLSAKALLTNQGTGNVPAGLFAIEPFPDKVLRAGFSGLTRLIQKKAEEVELEFFQTLGKNDILFIDSSHVVRTGGDVVYEYLEILPRLRPGVLVHIHDIFLPSDYPRKWVLDHRMLFTEQYLLQAFLSFNEAFEVLWSGSAMSIYYREALERAFPYWKESYLRTPANLKPYLPSYDGNNIWPSSLWIRRR